MGSLFVGGEDSLANLSIEQLEALQNDLKLTIMRKMHDARLTAFEQISAISESVGMSPEDLLAYGKRNKVGVASKSTPKYKDENGNTWGGRGKRPRWLNEYVANGGDVKDLLV